ncbi:hypothetical protein P872_13400 [Rhodonellum psychrophilum GCM71 = DSM 17998]|uniref:Outer membrane protein beta-barrel domain-containing protein n=2 Tax=Rhodonellum TaxID=336827 RepID=U5BR70_9BACT|nr:hypothetical protein P872_13400 [Rhodonellum psychrophilum GCM71 = DSM 17998]
MKWGMICLLSLIPFLVSSQVPTDLFLLNPNAYKAQNRNAERFYDRSEIQLTGVNDTLEIFIGENKKISYRWNDVSKQKGFDGWLGFNNDIEKFLQNVKSLDLAPDKNNYHFIFSPETEELKVILTPSARFSRIDGEFLPVYRHQVTLTYFSNLMEVDFFLGELDEILILKEADINQLVADIGEENKWYTDYKKKKFYKSMIISEDGEISIETFQNKENPYYPKLNAEVGIGLVGNEIPFMVTPRYNIRLKSKKDKPINHTLFFAMNLLTFQQKNEENKFIMGNDVFLGVGYESDVFFNKTSIQYGYRVLSDHGFFDDHKFMTRVDYTIMPRLKLFWSRFESLNFNERYTSSLNLVGLTFTVY